MRADASNRRIREIAGSCLANKVRMLNRAISALYDDALRPFGLRTSQMNVLVAVSVMGRPSPSQVSQALGMDKSTLSRNVQRMFDQGWLEAVPGEDGRTHALRATPAGRGLLERVHPAWEAAQEKAKDLFTETDLRAMGRMATRARRRR